MLIEECQSTATDEKRHVECVVVGKESVGKSQLLSSLTGISAGESNYRGSTVDIHRYRYRDQTFIDTPGILRKSDTETTKLALRQLQESDVVMLVIPATNMDDDLRDMLPLVVGKRGVVVVTFWDKILEGEEANRAIQRVSENAGVEFIPVNARKLTIDCRTRIEIALNRAKRFSKASLTKFAGWRIEPKPGLFEHRILGPCISILMLLLPALATIFGANQVAALLEPIVARFVDTLIGFVDRHFHPWAQILLTSKHSEFGYGLLNMGPFLLVWALPTILLFSIILAVYKSTGIIDRLNWALHPLMRPLGLSGRDAVRVMMGFGCNVPAVISTRACSGCSRGQAMSAIAFGAACSYQLPATLAVLAAVADSNQQSSVWLALVFLTYLMATTVVYLYATAPREAKDSLNVLMTPRRSFMQWPSSSSLWFEIASPLKQFFWQAIPIFILICIAASLLAHFGTLEIISQVIGPAMHLFNLPSESALAIVLSSVRKDGIFLLATNYGLAFPMTTIQALTAVYLASVFLPCLVTALTIARETNWKQSGLILIRQAAFALLFTFVLAWGGRYFV